MTKILWAAIVFFAGTVGAFAQGSSSMTKAPPDVVTSLAPTGKLRAAINFGNGVLAQKDPATGEPRGVSADLSKELAKRLSVPVEFVTFEAAGKVFEALKTGAWDIAFLAVEPVRAAEIDFTAPYVLIEGTYMVPKDSPLKVDRGRRPRRRAHRRRQGIGLRPLSHAHDQERNAGARADRRRQGDDRCSMRDKLEAAAGVKQPLVEYARTDPNVRVMDGRFMVIQQAMGTPKGRDAGARYLRMFIEEMKASGFVADALKRSNQPDAAVAPPSN